MTKGMFKGLLATTYRRWNSHNAPRLGAALAYYSLLSLAPLVILIVAICGLVFDKNMAERSVLGQTGQLIGQAGAATLRTLIASAHRPAAGVFATIIALLTLLFGASGVFLELRESLNSIWDAPPRTSIGWRDMIWQRLISFGMVIALGFLLLLSLLLSAVFAVVEKFATGVVPLPAAIIGEVLNLIISIVALAVLFGLIFKFVPNVPIDWRDVGVGAAVTAILFMIGKSLLALYLTTAAVGSAYGAAGSLVALVVWVYYSAQIFFFGAVFTRVFAESVGSRAGRKAAAARRDHPDLLARGQSA
jgi:membrane protein